MTSHGDATRPARNGVWGCPIVILVLVLGICLQACGANDVPFYVKVTNNTSQSVLLEACNGYGPTCGGAAYTLRLKPGASGSTAQDPDGILRPVMVQLESSGRTLGCLPLQFGVVTPASFRVYVSQMVPCEHSLGAQVLHGHDWPNPRY